MERPSPCAFGAPHQGVLSLLERPDQAVQLLGRHALPMVAHLEQHPRRDPRGGAPSPPRLPGEKVMAFLQQVGQDGGEPPRVGHHQGQDFGRHLAYLDAARRRLLLQPPDPPT